MVIEIDCSGEKNIARKRYTTEEIIRKVREAEVLIRQDQTVTGFMRHLGVSDVTYSRWRKDYGSLKVISHQVPPENRNAFRVAVRALGKARRRSGAYHWSLMQDAENTERFVETWFEPSWTDHLRHHGRVTEEDKRLQDAVRAHLAEGSQPQVQHHVSAARQELVEISDGALS